MWSVPALWPGETVYIVAGGGSVRSQNLELLRDKRVILINSSYERLAGFKSGLSGPLIPAADFLIFGDHRWWGNREPNHQKNILGLACKLVTVQSINHPKVLRLRKNKPPGLSLDRKSLTMRRTTLSAAINFAAMLSEPKGAIVLIGADGKFGPSGERNHHRPHRWKHIEGCWQRHHDELATLVKPLKEFGVTVLNASPGSAWSDLWQVVSLEDCINGDAIEMARK